jgi:hypothetical protein
VAIQRSSLRGRDATTTPASIYSISGVPVQSASTAQPAVRQVSTIPSSTPTVPAVTAVANDVQSASNTSTLTMSVDAVVDNTGNQVPVETEVEAVNPPPRHSVVIDLTTGYETDESTSSNDSRDKSLSSQLDQKGQVVKFPSTRSTVDSQSAKDAAIGHNRRRGRPRKTSRKKHKKSPDSKAPDGGDSGPTA